METTRKIFLDLTPASIIDPVESKLFSELPIVDMLQFPHLKRPFSYGLPPPSYHTSHLADCMILRP